MNFAEDNLTELVVTYIKIKYPHILFFHVANERKASPQAGARLKRKGVLAGVADLLLFTEDWHGAIELKSGKNKQTDSQYAFEQNWKRCNGNYALCHNLDDVIAAIELWESHG